MCSPARHRDAPQTLCGRCCALQIPRGLAVLMALVIAVGVLAGNILLIADAIQTFEDQHLQMYEDQGLELLNRTLVWTKSMFDVDGSYFVHQIREEVPMSSLIKSAVYFLVDMMMNMFWIFLFIVYLLFEQTSNKKSELHKKIDDQIQHYIVEKTVISFGVGISVYLILGPLLNVHMAHLFGVLTFFLNFVPNVVSSPACLSTLVAYLCRVFF